MVQKNGFNIQVLDSQGRPLREYGYTPSVYAPEAKNGNKTEVYLEIPSPEEDQTFSISVTRAGPSDGKTYFFRPTFDGVSSAFGHRLKADSLLFDNISLVNSDRTGYVNHKLRFQELLAGLDHEAEVDGFGTIVLTIRRAIGIGNRDNTDVDSSIIAVEAFNKRKRPYRAFEADSVESSGINTPDTIESNKKRRFMSPISTSKLSHSIALGDFQKYTGLGRSVFTTGIEHTIVFHYRNRTLLHNLGVIPGSTGSSSATLSDDLNCDRDNKGAFSKVFEKLQKLKEATDKDVKMEEVTGRGDDDARENGGRYDNDEELLCSEFRAMAIRLFD
ncbi:hypothetical protein BJ508DRAFT_342243 [Ascobolus immersus RN42]|uniref:Uncharacterized protein n=1 Tax=Ascobolus immersus RN42 TaxID=1160509 RepID=A0A3N4INP8_ASCIM|nr:hypothetical protein BJ508DRAFT_342243 [Ascobolus immersus RN42]